LDGYLHFAQDALGDFYRQRRFLEASLEIMELKLERKKAVVVALKFLLLTILFPISSAEAIPRSHLAASGNIPEIPLSSSELMGKYVIALEQHLAFSESHWHDYSATIPDSGYFGRGTCVEFGIRTTTYYSYVYAFLYKYSPNDLISGKYSKADLRERVIQSLRYLIATHKSINGGNCAQGGQWGQVWQSSMWSTRMGMAAWMVWDELDVAMQNQLRVLITDEADFLLPQVPPHNLDGDTKAEENGWDSNVLSLASAMFPQDERAYLWDEKAKEFMMNTLSVPSDLTNDTMVDGRPIAEWVQGPNLYSDFTSENHYIFHPVYIMVPIGELGNSAVVYAYGDKPVPAAAAHHVLDVWENVLKVITLADGEWFYPNGLTWMIHDYEHLSTLSWLATFFDNEEAALMESRTAAYLERRQNLQSDGSFFGELVDVGELREAVQAARLVDSYLYHWFWGAGEGDTQVSWEQIEEQVIGVTYFPNSEIVMQRSEEKIASFSWENKIMGVFTPQSKRHLDSPYVTLPYQSGFVGNRTLSNEADNLEVITRTVRYETDFFTTSGSLLEDDGAITHHLSFTSLPGAGVVYLEKLVANNALEIEADFGMPMGIEIGGAASITRTIYSDNDAVIWDGTASYAPAGTWINIDDRLGVITDQEDLFLSEQEKIRGANQSLLYGFYQNSPQLFDVGEVIASRAALILGDTGQTDTAAAASHFDQLVLDEGWLGVSVDEVDSRWLVASNFFGSESIQSVITTTTGAPIIPGSNLVQAEGTQYTFSLPQGETVVLPVHGFLACEAQITAQWTSDIMQLVLYHDGSHSVQCDVILIDDGQEIMGAVLLRPDLRYRVCIQEGKMVFLDHHIYLTFVARP
jgi:hypothetical protein